MIAELAASPDQSKWLKELSAAEKAQDRWIKRAKRIIKRYAQQSETEGADRQYALLWATTETIEPAVYSRSPKPMVSRRYRDADPVARTATVMLERAVGYTLDQSKLHEQLLNVRKDLVLVARGTMWFRYEPTFEPISNAGEIGDEPGYALDDDVGEDEEPIPQEELTDEKVCGDYVHWGDFLHGPGRTWEEVPWVARKVYMSREQLKARFGRTPQGLAMLPNIGLDHRPADDKSKSDVNAKATVHEIWCKADNKVYFVAKSAPEMLEVRPPMLRLAGFFPCPKPAFGTLSTDSLEPTPDYIYWQKQDDQVDKLTKRISKLQDAIKLVGFYPGGPQGAGSAAMNKALQPGTENEMIPVPEWAAFAEKGGSQMVQYLPIDMVMKVLSGCIETRRMLIEDIYQTTGVSDIMRGATEASETLGAQQLKAQWGSIRIRSKQGEMARFGRECCQIIAEIISEQFQPETFMQMTNMKLPSDAEVQMQAQQMALQYQQAFMAAQASGQQPPPQPEMPEPPITIDQVMGLLRQDRLRSFVVDVETDSTIQPDENAEKQNRTEFLTAAGGFMTQVMPFVQQVPEAAEMVGQMLLFGIRGFRAGRELEEAAEKFVEQITQKASQPPAPPQPTPEQQLKLETEKVKGASSARKSDADVRKAEIGAQTAALKLQQAAMPKPPAQPPIQPQ